MHFRGKTTVADAVSKLGTPCELNIYHLNKNSLMPIMIVEFEYVHTSKGVKTYEKTLLPGMCPEIVITFSTFDLVELVWHQLQAFLYVGLYTDLLCRLAKPTFKVLSLIAVVFDLGSDYPHTVQFIKINKNHQPY